RPTGTTFTVGELEEDAEYTISVRPVNAEGAGVPSDPITFTTGTPVDGSGVGGAGQLPYTGTDTRPLLALGLVLLAAGGALVALRRRAVRV
ncbi:MAG: fibronectin type III domain-containing protein, partial [Acidobacteria bacterium]|nr:fibronectin type III domain-containing protein [Acidobacteriota bacterium]